MSKSHHSGGTRPTAIDDLNVGDDIMILRGPVTEEVHETALGFEKQSYEIDNFNGFVFNIVALSVPFAIARARGRTQQVVLDLRKWKVRKPDEDYAKAFADMVRPPKKNPPKKVEPFGAGIFEVGGVGSSDEFDTWLRKQIQDFDKATEDPEQDTIEDDNK